MANRLSVGLDGSASIAILLGRGLLEFIYLARSSGDRLGLVSILMLLVSYWLSFTDWQLVSSPRKEFFSAAIFVKKESSGVT